MSILAVARAFESDLQLASTKCVTSSSCCQFLLIGTSINPEMYLVQSWHDSNSVNELKVIFRRHAHFEKKKQKTKKLLLTKLIDEIIWMSLHYDIPCHKTTFMTAEERVLQLREGSISEMTFI